MISPVECKEHVGGKSHLVLQREALEVENEANFEIRTWSKESIMSKVMWRKTTAGWPLKRGGLSCISNFGNLVK